MRAFLANRLSYYFGFTGPSYYVDTACSSSMYALNCAITSIRNGQCDAALVAGTNLQLICFDSICKVINPFNICFQFLSNNLTNNYI